MSRRDSGDGTLHTSAGRRRRRQARPVASVLAVLTVAGLTTWTYAALRDDGADLTAVAAPGDRTDAAAKPAADGAPLETTPAPPALEPQAPEPQNRFAPVVTDRIPAPTTSIALEAAVPGTTNMQPAAAAAFEAARTAAAGDGVTIGFRSAWRSAAYQQILFDRAVATYGSAAEAGRWVLSPDRSAHVKGYAIDVEPPSAGNWLEANGAAYGLCRTYDNEWWHFEYLATDTCPARLPSALG